MRDRADHGQVRASSEVEATRSPNRFCSLAAEGAPGRFSIEVERHFCVGPGERQSLMGGVGLAAAIHAMEAATQRPVVWATAQYLSYAALDERLLLDVDVLVSGRSTSQVHVRAHVGERQVLSVAGALGSRPDGPTVQFVAAPDVPRPQACAQQAWRQSGFDNLVDRFEKRHVPTDPDRGHACHWVRCRDEVLLDAGLLAIVADFFAGGLETTAGAMSLDNTLRVHPLPEARPAGWLLCDTRFAGIGGGSFHGEMQMFDEDGALLATASQSAMLPRPSN